MTKTLLFLGLRGNEAPDLMLGPAANQPPPEMTIKPVLRAFDKATGETISSLELPVSPTGTPMSYMLNGKQHIVLAYGVASSAGLIALALP